MNGAAHKATRVTDRLWRYRGWSIRVSEKLYTSQRRYYFVGQERTMVMSLADAKKVIDRRIAEQSETK
jgi:hypothetical protein